MPLSSSLLLLPFVFAAALATQQAAPRAAEPTAEPAVRIEGRVVDLRGEPVPNAEVWITSFLDGERMLARGRADGEGVFVLSRVPQRDFWALAATADGRIVGEEYVRRNQRVVTAHLHDAVAVTGTVRDKAGKPVASVPVRATLQHSRILFRVHCDAVTDGNGAFRLEKVPLGEVAVRAIVPGEGFAETRVSITGPADVAVQSGGLALSSLHVRVTGLPAEALARTHMLLLPYTDGSLQTMPSPWDHPALGADGTLSLDGVPQWEWLVRASAKGFLFAPSELRVKGAGPHELEFAASALGSGTPWRGTIVDADARPLAGVRLVLTGERDGIGVEATSDERGAFAFPCALPEGSKARIELREEKWRLDVEQGDDRFSRLVVVATATPLQVRAERACVVEGRVLLPDGRPAAFVDLEVGADVFDRWVANGYGTADRDGRYRIGGLGGLRALQAKVEGVTGSGRSEAVNIAPAAVAAIPDLRLLPQASIAGVLKDAAGAPCPGVRVWLRDWNLATGGQRSGSVTEVLTDHLGRYRFVGVPPGGAMLQLPTEQAGATTTTSDPLDVQPGAALTVDLALPAK